MKEHKSLLFGFLAVALSLSASLVVAEVALRARERARARDHLDYAGTWREGGLGPGGFLREGFTGDVVDGYGGTVRWVNNSQGFRNENETPESPSSGVLRVLSMGDSFTAGYRVDQEETFSRLLETRLNQVTSAEVLVSCVEDPVTGLDYLVRFGQRFQPDVVLLGITLGNDIAQTYIGLDPQGPYSLRVDGDAVMITPNEAGATLGFRHGLESVFVPDDAHRGQSRDARAWSKLERLRVLRLVREPAWPIGSWYGDSDRLRLFDAINGLGSFLAVPPARVEQAYQRLHELLGAYATFCRARDITFVVAVFPQRFQVQEEDWRATIRKWRLREAAFDLRAPNRVIAGICRSEGITYLDPTDTLQARHEGDGRSLYLPRGDMHWNRLGHEAFHEATIETMLALVGGAVPGGI